MIIRPIKSLPTTLGKLQFFYLSPENNEKLDFYMGADGRYKDVGIIYNPKALYCAVFNYVDGKQWINGHGKFIKYKRQEFLDHCEPTHIPAKINLWYNEIPGTRINHWNFNIQLEAIWKECRPIPLEA